MPIRNVQVKLLFSRPVDDTSASVIVITQNGGGNVAGTIDVNGSTVTFTPSAACPAPNADLKCFDGNADYTVTVGGSLRSTTGQTIVCGGFAPTCVATFHTGTLIDTQPPTVSMVAPQDGQGVPADSLVDVQAQANDESGVAYVDFSDNGTAIDTSGPDASSTQTSFLADVQWNTAGIALQSTRELRATAYDIDTHQTQSNAVNVVVRSPSCFNGVKDGDETGIDCGGTPGTPGFCGSCSGGSCTTNSQCASGVCLNGICVDQPTVTNVSPLDGKPGTFVTLTGSNFGTGGSVVFLGGSGDADDKVAQAPQACTAAGFTTWSPNEVIVAVPDGAASGPLKITNTQSGLTDATNDARGPKLPDFVVDDATYPGLCGLQPDNGYVGDAFKAVGQGFGTSPSQMTFGPSTLTSFSSWADAEITTNVPVVGVGSQTVKVKSGTTFSNPATYQVLNKSTSGVPVIASIDPPTGPKGEYVTLTGTNFGYTVGTVHFKNKSSGTDAIGDTSFPEACSVGFWKETSVIVKVPQQFLNTTGLVAGDYDVTLVRSDNAESNVMGFTVNDATPKPGICSITPSVGPEGTKDVTLEGERFGSSADTITFFSTKAAISSSWTSGEIKTTVPTGAVTGPVTITAQGVKSNPVNFQVRNCNEQAGICSQAEQCCPNGTCIPSAQSCGAVAQSAMFAWQSSTGLIPVAPRVVEECSTDIVPPPALPPVPSPSPWDKRAGGTNVCVNATIVARFTTHLDPTTVTKADFRVKKCTSASTEPCATTEDVDFKPGYPLLQSASADQDLVKLQPNGVLAPNTTYLVEITTGVKGFGATGANMEETPACGQGVAYCFRFKTRTSTDPCKIGSVSVSPHPYTLNDAGQTVPYLASPLSADDKCVVLMCELYDWAWEHGDGNTDGRALYENYPKTESESGKVSCRQVGIAMLETGNVPVNMNAIADPAGANVKGTGQLYVKFVPPRVEEYAPNCQLACINALVWARFNVAIDPKTVAGNIEVRPCANENCVLSELGAPIQIKEPITPSGVPMTTDTTVRFLPIVPADSLIPGKYYRVLLKGGSDTGIKGLNGVPMTGLNDPEGFAWTFRTKLGADAFCTAEAVNVSPLSKYETSVGARQLFTATAYGKPDACSAAGQMLVQKTDATWQITPNTPDPLVADFIGTGAIDTGGSLPARCDALCLAMGSQGEYGKVAMCGNGIIETTDEKYCVGPYTNNIGKTPFGEDCYHMPAGAKAGEECDPGTSEAPTADKGLCDPNTCLWKPLGQVPMGTCGNGVIDKGEACDYGRFCVGASSTSATPESCTSDTASSTCATNGGLCGPVLYRGCTPFCRHAGSKLGNSTCGNGDVADGEDCDDGNLTNGDGCTSDCLHEGSSPDVASVCGNAILEPGETCEKNLISDNEFPNGCNPKTCLHTGTGPCSHDPSDPKLSCCGNGTIDKGEDCDDSNSVPGDGCGSTCLLEGSSFTYQVPSFCSDGILGTGEQCEVGLPSSHPSLLSGPKNAAPTPPKGSPSGDGIIDNVQLATIVGDAEPDQNGLMSSTISATLEGKKGDATYGLQCGFSEESACNPPSEKPMKAKYGLTDSGCCNLRPALADHYPDGLGPDGKGVCRNVEIRATFNVPMNRDSVVSNVHIAKEEIAGNCPNGTTEVTDDFTPVKQGIGTWVSHVWKRIVAWWKGDAAIASTWCAGTVTGSWVPRSATGTTDYIFRLDSALEANTAYRVKFIGDRSTSPDPLSDNADLAKRTGVKTAKGVVTPYDTSADSGPLTFSFQTGDQVCAVNVIQVTDLNEDHPLLFTKQNEFHPFVATAVSLQKGVVVPIVPVSEYAWSWEPWVTSDDKVLQAETSPTDPTAATVTADNKNGNAFVVATLHISEDTVQIPSTTGRTVQGTAPATVMLCENPWPNLNTAPIAPFRDKAPTGDGKDSSLLGSIYQNGPYFNFSTMYCRDAGDATTADDLPELTINFVPKTSTDAIEGILRQYLFTYGDAYAALKKDGIGIRVASNPLHLSPEDWYAWRGFGGSPKSILVDGYRALTDGNTTYVAAANTDGPGRTIYSNVYLISHNPDASPVTVGIYDQMVANLAFNINITQGVGNVCLVGNYPNDYSTSIYPPDGSTKPIACSADADCVKLDENSHCGSFKLKLARDTVRVADFAAMSKAIEAARSTSGSYPKLTAGTFLQGFTNSKWPSWAGELSTALGGTQPEDPVNTFLTCGKCSQSQMPCGADSDCGADQTCGGVTLENGDFVHSTTTEAATCWNTEQRKFFCPEIKKSPSRVYQYRSVDAGARYELSAEFEVPEPSPDTGWWSPPLMTEISRCVNTSTRDFLCTADSDCRDCPNPQDPSCHLDIINGACRKVGGNFKYQDVCTNQDYGQSGTCGDGVIGQACSGTDKRPCVSDTQCLGDGTCSGGEACEVGQTKIVDCTTADGKAGLKLQACSECKGFKDDVNLSTCNAAAACGNGRIDKMCTGGMRDGLGCLTDADCKGNGNSQDGTCQTTPNEVCDDGALNGTYGHCNLTCSGYAAYCGDGMISPGESCDKGQQNGAYCGVNCNVTQSCSLDCKGKAPHCGDAIVTSPEQCDGETQTTIQAICTAGTAMGQPCATDADCGNGGACAPPADPLGSCQGVTKKRCATSLKQCVSADLATCGGQTPYAPSAHKVCTSDTECAGQPNNQTSCRALTDFCIDCANDNQCSYTGIPGTCNTMATAHVRSCSAPGNPDQCSFSSWSGCKVLHYCGDGTIDAPAEECDDGTGNGDTKACTSTCKKNVCGDGKPYVAVEECDAGAQNGHVTCSADYGSTCASCSTQCRFLTTAGGYCGDLKKNGPEQCDGDTPVDPGPAQFACPSAGRPAEVCPYLTAGCIQSPCQKTTEANVTCQQLGYDFPTNATRPKLTYLDPSLNVLMAVPVDQACPNESGMRKYEKVILEACLGMQCIVGNDPSTNHWAFNDPIPSPNDFWKCAKEKGPALGVAVTTSGNAQLLQCSASCAFTGCGKCSDEVGSGIVSGQLWDGVYGQVIPFARVSLYYKGIVVQQVASDADGKFTVTGLNNRPECAQYKIVVDKYDDNPCTGNLGGRPNCGLPSAPDWPYPYNVNEGERGGYWPYTSPVFSVTNFMTNVAPTTPQGQPARIFVFPRPGPGEAYFSVLWDVNWTNGCTVGTNGNHLVLPTQFAYTPAATIDTTVCNGGQNAGHACSKGADCPGGACNAPNPGYPANFTPANCDWTSGPTADGHMCARDITWRIPGYTDLNMLPYSYEICLHKAGDLSCGNANDAVNGCPVEGRDKCIAAGGDPAACTKGTAFSSCTNPGPHAQDLCSSDADCDGGTCQGLMCNFESWDTCWFYNTGPLTTYFRYAAFNGAVEPIRMFWGYWNKSVNPILNAGGNALLTHLQGNKYHVVVSTDQHVYEISAQDITQNCGKDCKFWHIADLNPTTGDVSLRNELLGQRGEPNGTPTAASTAGLACYEYQFQGLSASKYCVDSNGALIKQCSTQADCPSGTGTCQAVDTVTAAKANY